MSDAALAEARAEFVVWDRDFRARRIQGATRGLAPAVRPAREPAAPKRYQRKALKGPLVLTVERPLKPCRDCGRLHAGVKHACCARCEERRYPRKRILHPCTECGRMIRSHGSRCTGCDRKRRLKGKRCRCGRPATVGPHECEACRSRRRYRYDPKYRAKKAAKVQRRDAARRERALHDPVFREQLRARWRAQKQQQKKQRECAV